MNDTAVAPPEPRTGPWSTTTVFSEDLQLSRNYNERRETTIPAPAVQFTRAFVPDALWKALEQARKAEAGILARRRETCGEGSTFEQAKERLAEARAAHGRRVAGGQKSEAPLSEEQLGDLWSGFAHHLVVNARLLGGAFEKGYREMAATLDAITDEAARAVAEFAAGKGVITPTPTMGALGGTLADRARFMRIRADQWDQAMNHREGPPEPEGVATILKTFSWEIFDFEKGQP